MHRLIRLFAATCLVVLAGCGGGGGGGGVVATAVPLPAVSNSLGPTLRAIVGRNYTVYDLGQLRYSLPGWLLFPGAGSISLNDGGDVVSALNDTPYVWTTTTVTMLDGRFKSARALNNRGQVAGDTWNPQNVNLRHGAIWRAGAVTDLGSLMSNGQRSNDVSNAFGINDAGQVVGESAFPSSSPTDNGRTHAFIYSDGKLYDLGSLGGPGSYATSINADGVIVGSAETSELRAVEKNFFGYYYDYFAYYGYGFVGIGGGNVTGGLNSGGGSAGGSGSAPSGFAGGGDGRAAGGRAVGDERSYNVAHAFVYADNTIFDLNKLLPIGSGWELTQASAINAKGQIVGMGMFQGQLHGYFLKPR